MHFKVTARTILQLGAELISSDAIAFYELIKNSFDAMSPNVEVRVIIRLEQDKIENAYERINNNGFLKKQLRELVNELIDSVDFDAPNVDQLKTELGSVSEKYELISVLKKANYIIIKDGGEGMSLQDLDRIYLTIGTRNRYEQRNGESLPKNSRPVLGEKGLGRLSVMRLGDSLIVETTKQGETHYNILEIDWSVFSHDSNDLLESIELEPRKGKLKVDRKSSGTTIWIYDLKSRWTKDKLSEIGRDELSRFIDPFQRANRDFIELWFNKQAVILSGIDKILFESAQASVKAELSFNRLGQAQLQGSIDYRLYNRQKSFYWEGTHLSSIAESSIEILRSLGPFQVEFHWYNRKRITVKYGISDVLLVKNLVDRWGGGIMVYRDGFRVNPYGGPDDDWLKLDPKAFSVGGYKLNRRQIVGKLDIASSKNPKLLDQTNREGLRDSLEKSALINLLQYIIWYELKPFLDSIEKDETERNTMSLKDIEKRILIGERKAKQSLEILIKKFPKIKEEEDILESFDQVFIESRNLIKSAKASATSLKNQLNTTIHLAGLGLMVDVIGHELKRATHHAIQTLNKLSSSGSLEKNAGSFNTLKSQLKTLHTRLKVIDPLGPAGRQKKEVVDLADIVSDTLQYHTAQFQRHGIKLIIEDSKPNTKWEISAVPGMIIQVLENLISNSVYWLKQEKLFGNLKNPQISIKLDRKNSNILFSDNGPGIPLERSEDIFQPFVSSKPPDEGKGLGLYISREIAEYHGASLYLVDDGNKILRTFVLQLTKSK